LVQRFIFLLTKTRSIRKYISQLEDPNSLLTDCSEFKKLFSQEHHASYLEEEVRNKLVMTLPNDLELNISEVLTNCYRICQDIEIKRPIVAMNLYMDIMLAIDRALAPVENSEQSNFFVVF
jgi:hypothetical protein